MTNRNSHPANISLLASSAYELAQNTPELCRCPFILWHCVSYRLGQFKVERSSQWVLPFWPSIDEQEMDQDWLNRRTEVFSILLPERKKPFWESIHCGKGNSTLGIQVEITTPLTISEGAGCLFPWIKWKFSNLTAGTCLLNTASEKVSTAFLEDAACPADPVQPSSHLGKSNKNTQQRSPGHQGAIFRPPCYTREHSQSCLHCIWWYWGTLGRRLEIGEDHIDTRPFKQGKTDTVFLLPF